MSNQIDLCYHPSSFQLACNCESQPAQNTSITYLVNLSGGISPGIFSISVNGSNSFATNQTDSGVINAPIGSLIQVYISAPVGDTSGGQSPSFYSNAYAQDASGVIATSGTTTNNPSSMIEFTLSAETSIYASASVNSSGNGEVIQ